jgi:hypothetical protein
VPAGAIVNVVDHPLDGHQLIEILREGKVVLMFTSDIRENGIPVSSTDI